VSVGVRGTPRMVKAMADPPEDRAKWMACLIAIRKLPERRTKGAF
jgi:hypothetical protein